MVDLRLDDDLAGFRAEVRAFLADEMSPARTAGHEDPSDLTGLDITFEREHQRRAGERGFLGISVPAEYGGGGRPLSWKAVYSFEAAYFDAPSIDTAITLCGAPLLAFGSEEQKQRFVPAMVRGETQWCIAYTEPGAGSDLAAIEATATPVAAGRQRSGYVLRGHKSLVTGAHKSQWCLTIARTDPSVPARKAMAMFVVPLDAEGVSVRRRETANGWTLCDVLFDGVRLPADALLGGERDGWRQLTASLVEERSGAAWLGWATRLLDDLEAWARRAERTDAWQPMAALRADLAVGHRFAERTFSHGAGALTATPDSAAAAAMAKVWATELLQRIAHAALDLAGIEALAWSPLFAAQRPDVPLGGRIAYEVLERIHGTISVGANELQRDTIARGLLQKAGGR